MILSHNRTYLYRLKRIIVVFFSAFLFPKIRSKNFRKALLSHGIGRLKITGKNNRVILVKDNQEIPLTFGLAGLTLTIDGDNNVVKIGYPWHFEHTVLSITGNGNTFSVESCLMGIKRSRFELAGGSQIIIGKNFGISGSAYFNIGEENNMSLHIGDDVIFSYNTVVRTSDSHTIYDSNTHQILNYGQDIVIGNHVWICEGAALLKGTRIADNCVIGTKSVVNRAFPESGIIIAGIPARVVKTGINWDIKSIPLFKEENK